jgi:hypothetical protein
MGCSEGLGVAREPASQAEKGGSVRTSDAADDSKNRTSLVHFDLPHNENATLNLPAFFSGDMGHVPERAVYVFFNKCRIRVPQKTLRS